MGMVTTEGGLLDEREGSRRWADERLRLATEAAHLGLWEWDIINGAVFWSPGLDAIHGIPTGRFPGTFEAWKRDIHPDDLDRVLAIVAEGVEKKTGHIMEYRIIRHNDGVERWLEVHSRVQCDAQGRPARMLGVCTDVTERKRAEEALRESEERFRNMADTVPDILFSGRLDGTNDYASGRFHELTGLPPGAALGHGWAQTLVPEDGERLKQAWREAVESGRPFEGRGRMRCANGSVRWQIIRARPIFDEAGQIRRWFGCVTDVDDQVRAEEEARAALRARDNILAVVSHDLRNPLTAIQFGVSALMQEAEPQWAKRIEAILRSAERMNHLIGDLLTAATVEAGSFTVESSREQVFPIIEESLAALASQAAAKSIRIEHDAPVGLPAIQCDRLRTVQALGNLLGNAVKFTPVGGIIRVRVAIRANDVHVAVSDNGPGIVSDEIPHVFDRYWKSKAERRQGIGLGLYIARGIIEAQGGRIWVDSEPGAGSTFFFTIPVAPGAA